MRPKISLNISKILLFMVYLKIFISIDLQIFRHSALAHYDILDLHTNQLYKLSEVSK